MGCRSARERESRTSLGAVRKDRLAVGRMKTLYCRTLRFYRAFPALRFFFSSFTPCLRIVARLRSSLLMIHRTQVTITSFLRELVEVTVGIIAGNV